MKLDLRQLRYFLAIGESGALSHAAQKLNLAQSAVSHHLAELEAKLGVQLVERHPRGIRLTAAGERLQEHARAIVASVAKAEEDVRAFAEEAAGPVSVGLSHTATKIASLALMRAVRREAPNVILGLIEAQSIPLVARLLAKEIDLVVVYNPPEDARIESVPILEEEMCFVGHPDLLDNREDPIAFADVLAYPLVLQYPTDASRALVDSFILRNQLPERVMEVDSLIGITHAIADGIGCSIMAKATLRDEIAAGSIIARPIVEPVLNRTLHLASLRDRPRTRALTEIGHLVVATIRAEVRKGRWEARALGA
jgi:LysR family nitrogen assimilation transcriptional regulator